VITLKIDQVYCAGSSKCLENDKLLLELWSFKYPTLKAIDALSITGLISG